MSSVLLISNHADIVGGGELSFLGLVEHLDRVRWNPSVLVPGEGGLAERCRAMGLPTHIVPLPGLRPPSLGALRSLTTFRRVMASVNAGLLHANGSRAMLYAGIAGRLSGRPVIWHVRVAEADPLLDRPLAALASVIVVNSRAVARRFSWARREKVCCIYNGVDLERFKARPVAHELKRALGLPAEAPVVASVARFDDSKDHAVLIAAARLVREQAPGLHWILVGDGPLRPVVDAERRRLGLEDRVHLLGWRDDVPDLLALSRLFVLAAKSEGFGRVLIEAAAMAKAVVATRSGGIPEVVVDGETGLLMPPGQPERLAEAVLALLGDPGRCERLGTDARTRAERCFSLTRHVEQIEALYAQVLGSRDGRV